MRDRSHSAWIGASLLFGLLLVPAEEQGQIQPDTSRQMIRLIADRALQQGSFQFTNRSGRFFAAPEEGATDTTVGLASPSNDWRYWNGVLGIALFRTAEALNTPAYARLAMKNIAFTFDHYRFFQRRHAGESKWEYPFGQFFMMEELDDCGAMGTATIETYLRDPQGRYREYIDRAATHMLERQARIPDGTLVRTFPRKWTLWADDLYMSVPFLARLAELRKDTRLFDEAAKQVVRFHRHLFDSTRGLMAHCWYSEGGGSRAFWGRANGWAVLAQVELLERLPADHPEREQLVRLLRTHLLGLLPYQSPSGRWHQLLDKPDSYLETSCSAMFTCGIARAVRTGILPAEYASAARRGWRGVCSAIRPDGQIEGICAGTGVSDELRDYYTRPTPLDDPNGTGAVLLAGTEMLLLEKWMDERTGK